MVLERDQVQSRLLGSDGTVDDPQHTAARETFAPMLDPAVAAGADSQ